MDFDILPKRNIILILIFNILVVDNTVDINLPQFQYIADHLEPQECRRLVASLHFHTYDLPVALDEAELRMSKDISCIRLLLHWNSEPGEGKGETHEVLQHRLRQLGKLQLADWVGRTVFHELGKDIQRSMDEPFRDLATVQPRKIKYGPQRVYNSDDQRQVPTEWLPFDTICYTAVVVLLLIILGVCLKVLYKFRKKLGYWPKYNKKKKYKKVEEVEDTSTTDSEIETFDVRQV